MKVVSNRCFATELVDTTALISRYTRIITWIRKHNPLQTNKLLQLNSFQITLIVHWITASPQWSVLESQRNPSSCILRPLFPTRWRRRALACIHLEHLVTKTLYFHTLHFVLNLWMNYSFLKSIAQSDLLIKASIKTVRLCRRISKSIGYSTSWNKIALFLKPFLQTTLNRV